MKLLGYKTKPPYTKDSYYAGKDYEAIDISGEYGSTQLDLSILHKFDKQFDLLVDAGTSEHVGKDGKHDMQEGKEPPKRNQLK